MRLLILRGDLRSHSGYSTAARAYCRQLESFFDEVVGVDLHFAPHRPFEPFPHPVVSDQEAQQLARQAHFALALSVSTPDAFATFPQAVNVGLTFWECDRFPLDPKTSRPALAQANGMDTLWVPSTHTRKTFRAAGVRVPIRVIPWPLRVSRRSAGALPPGHVYDLDVRLHSTAGLAACAICGGLRRGPLKSIGEGVSRAVLSQLRTSSTAIVCPAERAFLCVAQDFPRKALKLLLSEWLEFKRRPEAAPYHLILKTSPPNPEMRSVDLVVPFWRQVQALKQQLGVRRAGVYLWTADLPTTGYHRLLASTFGHVASGLGEGFCGPAATALRLGKPLVAPRHTAFNDYLPADYPYSYAVTPAIVRFAHDEVGVYDPASSWHVPEPFAIADALSRLVLDRPEHFRHASRSAEARVRSWCRPARVRRLLEREVARLTQGARERPSIPHGSS